MLFDDYQDFALSTAVYPHECGLSYTALGLCGEAGEYADKIKKILRDSGGIVTEEKREKLIDELGDVAWYLAACASELGVELSTVVERNVEKLSSRKERGVLKGSGDDR